MTGIIIAAVVVSLTGLILGLFLGVMGKKFAVEVDQKKLMSEQNFRVITAAAAVTQAVMPLQRQSQQEKHR